MTNKINAEVSAWQIYQRLLRYLKPYVFLFGVSVVGYELRLIKSAPAQASSD